ncbi:pentatricopeptide (PPR) repeat protein [Medicago truncatula]|uniref:Pentatricopeptide (PPR) repeat protein n=1 Tax=Medicago truncatula TaxID=3880 RepID=A0A072UB53_MEDTR|nr:pentatricopeptide (PPR) repeat protein [Medicago truncatula]
MYTTIIDSLCKYKLVNDAFDLYSEMAAKRICPDVVTYSALISGVCIVVQNINVEISEVQPEGKLKN